MGERETSGKSGITILQSLSDGWLLSAIVLLLLAVSPVLIYPYLYHDDWQYYAGQGFARCNDRWFYLLGRPLGNAFLCVQFNSFSGIDGAYLSRLETIIGVTLLLGIIYRFLRNENLPREFSAFVALGVVLLPGVLVTIFWLGAGFIAFSLLLSAYAALLCQRALRQDKKGNGFYGLLLGAAVSELAAAYTYQTGAMMFLVLSAVVTMHVVKEGRRYSDFWRSLLVYGGVFLVSNLVYFSWFKFSIAEKLAKVDPERGTLFHNLISGMEWFAQEALPRALQLWFIDASANWASYFFGICFVVALVGFTLLRLYRKERRQSALWIVGYVAVIVLLGVGCFLPMIVSSFRLAVFRSLIPLSAFVFVMTSVQLFLLGKERGYSVLWGRLGLGGMMIGIGLVSHNMLRDEMVVPRNAEIQELRRVMDDAKTAGREREPVYVIVPAKVNPWKTDEVGALSVSFPQDVFPIVNNIRNDMELPPVKVMHGFPGDKFDPTGKVVADLSGLQYW